MLGQVEALEPGLVGEPDQLEPVPEQPLRVGVPGISSMWSKMPKVGVAMSEP